MKWRFEVHDYRNQLLASKTGQTTNGEIRWSWNLRDTNGRLHDTLEEDPYFIPDITTWPIGEQPKGGQLLAKIPQDGWWNQRLGKNFVRIPPSHEERRKRFSYSESSPLENPLPPRPWNIFTLQKTNATSPP